MENEDPNRIVTEEYLTQHMGLSKSWIARHARACGCFARKPRRFFLSHVMAHIHALTEEVQTKACAKRAYERAQRQTVDKIFDQVARKNKVAGNRSSIINFVDYYSKTKKVGKKHVNN